MRLCSNEMNSTRESRNNAPHCARVSIEQQNNVKTASSTHLGSCFVIPKMRGWQLCADHLEVRARIKEICERRHHIMAQS